MKKDVVNLMNKTVSEIELPDSIFKVKVLPDLLHQYIRYQNSKNRQGSHKTKSRSEVKGGSKKPFSQKGTGNARQGSSKPPNFRGGAVSMGPKNRDYSFSLNKKEKILALKCALSEKIKKDEIILIDSFEIKSHKTKELFKTLKNFSFDSALFIFDDNEKKSNFKKASSNIPKLTIRLDKGLNVKDIISYDKIFIEQKSIEQISKRLL
tara:strand:- start:1441 stop:2064 length:624 start_codon:yes stop_codon:yes gene_type:complete